MCRRPGAENPCPKTPYAKSVCRKVRRSAFDARNHCFYAYRVRASVVNLVVVLFVGPLLSLDAHARRRTKLPGLIRAAEFFFDSDQSCDAAKVYTAIIDHPEKKSLSDVDYYQHRFLVSSIRCRRGSLDVQSVQDLFPPASLSSGVVVFHDLVEDNQLQAAEVLLEALSERFRGSKEPTRLHVQMLESQGKHREAYEKSAKLMREPIRLDDALLNYDLEESATSSPRLPSAQVLTKRFPNSWQSWLRLTYAYLEAGDLDAANTAYTRFGKLPKKGEAARSAAWELERSMQQLKQGRQVPQKDRWQALLKWRRFERRNSGFIFY